MLPRYSLLRIIVIILPIAVGGAFTGIGSLNFYEVTVPAPPVKLPSYGFLPFGSSDFEPGDLVLEVYFVSPEEGFVDGVIDFTFRLKDPRGEQTFGFQIPYEIDVGGLKILGYSHDGEEAVIPGSSIENGPHVLSTRNDTSIIYDTFQVSPEYKEYRIIVEVRWKQIIAKRGFFSYEIVVPFERSQCNVVQEHLPDAMMMHHEGLPLSLKLALPSRSRIIEAIPPPDQEEIRWLELGGTLRQCRFIAFERIVDFGLISQLPEQYSFRTGFELSDEKERHERLLFDSGLFLGVGIQLIVAGIYEGTKYREERTRIDRTLAMNVGSSVFKQVSKERPSRTARVWPMKLLSELSERICSMQVP